MQISWVCFFSISPVPFFCVREAAVPEVVPAVLLSGGERPRTSQKYECWYYWGTVPTPETTHLQTPVNTYTHKLRKPLSLRHRYLWLWLLEAEHNFNKYEGSDQIRSVAQSCPTLCDPMNRSTPGLPVHHQIPEFTQTHVHRVSDAIQSSQPLSSPSPPLPNPSQPQGLFQYITSSHEVAKVLEFQL